MTGVLRRRGHILRRRLCAGGVFLRLCARVRRRGQITRRSLLRPCLAHALRRRGCFRALPPRSCDSVHRSADRAHDAADQHVVKDIACFQFGVALSQTLPVVDRAKRRIDDAAGEFFDALTRCGRSNGQRPPRRFVLREPFDRFLNDLVSSALAIDTGKAVEHLLGQDFHRRAASAVCELPGCRRAALPRLLRAAAERADRHRNQVIAAGEHAAHGVHTHLRRVNADVDGELAKPALGVLRLRGVRARLIAHAVR